MDIHFANFIGDLCKEDDPEIILGAALLSHATGQGDICVDLESFSGKQMMEDQNDDIPVMLPKLDQWFDKIRKSSVVGKPGEFYPLILDKNNRLYLYRYWEYEHILAESINRRIKQDVKKINASLLQDSLKRLFPKESEPQHSKNHINWQKIASITAAIKNFCVISGGPGTGKTYTSAKILAILLEQEHSEPLRIFLCAPTGKAAAKLSESIKKTKQELNCSDAVKRLIPLETYTIHRMLQTIPGSPYFRYHSENLLPADVVLVDEASMVDLALMSKMISSIPMTARLILMGDRNQLASVESGSVFGDICDPNGMQMFSTEYSKTLEIITGQKLEPELEHKQENEPENKPKNKPTNKPTNKIAPLITNFTKGQGLPDCIVVLKKSLRFSETSNIGELTQAVNNGEWEEILPLLKKKGTPQIKWQQPKDLKDTYNVIGKKIIQGYSEYLKENDPLKALEQFNNFKLLCALKLGPLGVYGLSRLAEEVLKKEKLILMDMSDVYPWYRGRPVLITKNDYSLGLFNGDMGITMPDPKQGGKNLYVFFPEASGGVKRYPTHKINEHETAYAITVHKSQGSEFDHLCLVLPDKDYLVLTRELVYTGITRARKSLMILGNEHVLKAAVSRSIDRTSGLRDALWE
ncbi:MAG: exodeoxyribonuclease V subunit alpha [Desulfobacterales bacterium]|nr:exodeoxyribonuclease V subunit alpha [Desulfobacterales bacterium]